MVLNFLWLGETELEYVRKAVEATTISEDATSQDENLTNLAYTSVISSINKDIALADLIAEKIVRLG